MCKLIAQGLGLFALILTIGVFSTNGKYFFFLPGNYLLCKVVFFLNKIIKLYRRVVESIFFFKRG